MKDNKVVTIEHHPTGDLCHIPDNLTIDELGLLIQAASHDLKTKQVALGKARDQEGRQSEPMHTFDTGAKRSEKIEARYDLIPTGALRRLALRYGMGAQKYGEWNWQKGLPFSDTYNHIIEHLEKFKLMLMSGSNMTDDDLAGAAWGIFALMVFQDRGDYSQGNLRQLLGVERHPQWDNPKTNPHYVPDRLAREAAQRLGVCGGAPAPPQDARD